MIKGVNKQIIEINDIENEYFYKAILFVRPESSPRSHEYLSKRANEYIMFASCDVKEVPSGFLRGRYESKKRRLITAISLACFVAVSVAILLILL